MMRAFFDTNVLVYCIDPVHPGKQGRSFEVQNVMAASRQGVISGQVLSEFANVAVGKLRAHISRERARTEVRRLAEMFPVVYVTPRVVDLAIEGVERFGFSYYDAQIWAAAKTAGCSFVLSEDFSDGFEADGVHFRDPFAEGFDPATSLA
ncbi:MAG: PIN domain nuclease [Coriobacteriaceae bacterium]|nr:PIN domain nuclease [Coriobacteriaceae bacterium]